MGNEMTTDDAHGTNQEVVKEFLRAMELEGNFLGEVVDLFIPEWKDLT